MKLARLVGIGALLGGAIMFLGGEVASALPSPVCSAGTCQVTFAETGAPVTWTVPSGVTSIGVTLYGANGGANIFGNATGGFGAEVTGTVGVTPSEILTVNVGGVGAKPTVPQTTTVPGYNGGGAVGEPSSDQAGTGGGATDLSDGATNLLVAGGGGGASSGFASGTGPSNGGNADTVGAASGPAGSGAGGGGFSGDAGGNGGAAGSGGGCIQDGTSGGNGSPGQGGTGGTKGNGDDGGGGGGGVIGGGGGGSGAECPSVVFDPSGGGGGGSSLDNGPGVTGGSVNDSPSDPGQSGNGEAIITYTQGPTVTLHFSGSLTQQFNNEPITSGSLNIGTHTVSGTLDIAGLNGGTAVVKVGIAQVLDVWVGYVTVSDPGAHLNTAGLVFEKTLTIANNEVTGTAHGLNGFHTYTLNFTV